MDCIFNKEFPFLPTAAASFMALKSKHPQGIDWATQLSVGSFYLMYKSGDWWVWQPK